MRALRTLVAVGLTVSLLAIPALTTAQDDTGSDGPDAPLARQPLDRLPLEGTPWRLHAYRWKGAERVPGPEVAATLLLGPASLTASGGCTKFGGRYGTTGSAIDFELRNLKDNDCAEQITIVQLGMVDGLRKATSWEIRGTLDEPAGELVLKAPNGTEQLRFGLDDTGALDVGEWQLASYVVDAETTGASAEQPAVVSFQAQCQSEARRTASGTMTGSTGCNGVVGEFFRHADVMSFGELERTDAPCTPELAAQEAAMLAVLEATSSSLTMTPDRLTITATDTDAGNRLEFVSSRPLEGSTWLLTKLPGVSRSADAVTLRLEDGTAMGEGPCGPYSARYVSDGLFITFEEVTGTADDECEAIDAEKALLGALRGSVRLDRDQARLNMLDARGQLTVRFKPPSGP